MAYKSLRLQSMTKTHAHDAETTNTSRQFDAVLVEEIIAPLTFKIVVMDNFKLSYVSLTTIENAYSLYLRRKKIIDHF